MQPPGDPSHFHESIRSRIKPSSTRRHDPPCEGLSALLGDNDLVTEAFLALHKEFSEMQEIHNATLKTLSDTKLNLNACTAKLASVTHDRDRLAVVVTAVERRCAALEQTVEKTSATARARDEAAVAALRERALADAAAATAAVNAANARAASAAQRAEEACVRADAATEKAASAEGVRAVAVADAQTMRQRVAELADALDARGVAHKAAVGDLLAQNLALREQLAELRAAALASGGTSTATVVTAAAMGVSLNVSLNPYTTPLNRDPSATARGTTFASSAFANAHTMVGGGAIRPVDGAAGRPRVLRTRHHMGQDASSAATSETDNRQSTESDAPDGAQSYMARGTAGAYASTASGSSRPRWAAHGNVRRTTSTTSSSSSTSSRTSTSGPDQSDQHAAYRRAAARANRSARTHRDRHRSSSASAPSDRGLLAASGPVGLHGVLPPSVHSAAIETLHTHLHHSSSRHSGPAAGTRAGAVALAGSVGYADMSSVVATARAEEDTHHALLLLVADAEARAEASACAVARAEAVAADALARAAAAEGMAAAAAARLREDAIHAEREMEMLREEAAEVGELRARLRAMEADVSGWQARAHDSAIALAAAAESLTAAERRADAAVATARTAAAGEADVTQRSHDAIERAVAAAAAAEARAAAAETECDRFEREMVTLRDSLRVAEEEAVEANGRLADMLQHSATESVGRQVLQRDAQHAVERARELDQRIAAHEVAAAKEREEASARIREAEAAVSRAVARGEASAAAAVAEAMAELREARAESQAARAAESSARAAAAAAATARDDAVAAATAEAHNYAAAMAAASEREGALASEVARLEAEVGAITERASAAVAAATEGDVATARELANANAAAAAAAGRLAEAAARAEAAASRVTASETRAAAAEAAAAAERARADAAATVAKERAAALAAAEAAHAAAAADASELRETVQLLHAQLQATATDSRAAGAAAAATASTMNAAVGELDAANRALRARCEAQDEELRKARLDVLRLEASGTNLSASVVGMHCDGCPTAQGSDTLGLSLSGRAARRSGHDDDDDDDALEAVPTGAPAPAPTSRRAVSREAGRSSRVSSRSPGADSAVRTPTRTTAVAVPVGSPTRTPRGAAAALAAAAAATAAASSRPVRVYVGLELSDGVTFPPNDDTAAPRGRHDYGGLRVVAASGPAAAAGLRPMDLVVKVGGASVTRLDQFARVVACLRVGDDVPLEIVRGSEVVVTTLVPVAATGAAGTSSGHSPQATVTHTAAICGGVGVPPMYVDVASAPTAVPGVTACAYSAVPGVSVAVPAVVPPVGPLCSTKQVVKATLVPRAASATRAKRGAGADTHCAKEGATSAPLATSAGGRPSAARGPPVLRTRARAAQRAVRGHSSQSHRSDSPDSASGASAHDHSGAGTGLASTGPRHGATRVRGAQGGGQRRRALPDPDVSYTDALSSTQSRDSSESRDGAAATRSRGQPPVIPAVAAAPRYSGSGVDDAFARATAAAAAARRIAGVSETGSVGHRVSGLLSHADPSRSPRRASGALLGHDPNPYSRSLTRDGDSDGFDDDDDDDGRGGSRGPGRDSGSPPLHRGPSAPPTATYAAAGGALFAPPLHGSGGGATSLLRSSQRPPSHPPPAHPPRVVASGPFGSPIAARRASHSAASTASADDDGRVVIGAHTAVPVSAMVTGGRLGRLLGAQLGMASSTEPDRESRGFGFGSSDGSDSD